MTLPFLKKYQPKQLEEFQKDKDIIDIINILIDMENPPIKIKILPQQIKNTLKNKITRKKKITTTNRRKK